MATFSRNQNYGLVVHSGLFGSITNEEVKNIIQNCPTRIDKVIIKNTTKLTQVDFSNLKEVSEINIFGNEVLERINFKDLETVYEGLYIGKNKKLSSISFSKLKKVRGGADPTHDRKREGLTIVYNENLSLIKFPELVKIGDNFDSYCGLNIYGNKKIVSFEFPKLVIVNHIVMEDNQSLSGFSLPELVIISHLEIVSNQSLTSFEFSKLTTTERISIQGNQNLNNFGFPELITVKKDGDYYYEGFNIHNNKKLTEFEFPKLANFDKLRFGREDRFGENNQKQVGNNNFSSSIEKLLKHFVEINLKDKEIQFYDYTPTEKTQDYINTLRSRNNVIEGVNDFIAEPLNKPYIEFITREKESYIDLVIYANNEDQQDVWIDLNCNSIREAHSQNT